MVDLDMFDTPQDQLNKRVLFISHIFPPAGGPGVQRSVKFVKFLPGFGWKPVVLTVDRVTQTALDETLEIDVPAETEIVRAHSVQPRDDDRSLLRYVAWGVLTPLSVPDLGNWWLPWAVPAGLREIRRRTVSVIYATGAPFSSHILGAILKAVSGVPLVLDYRDEWTLDPVRDSGQPLYWRALFSPVERLQQRWVVHQADRVLLATDSARHAFVERYGEPQKFVTIRNGYDPEDFATSIEPNLPAEKLRIVYTGSTLAPVASPHTFLRGFRLAIDRNPSVSDKVHVYFVGEVDTETKRLIAELEIESRVSITGYVSHRESVGFLRQADVLLLIANFFPSRVPGKLYEYLGAKKPVLVLACRDGEAVGVLTRAGTAIWADPRDASDIADRLIELEESWSNGDLTPNDVNDEFIRTHSRERLAGRLATIFDDIGERYRADRRAQGRTPI